MITNKNEAKAMIEHISCDCKCKFNSTRCNSKQKWNNETCKYFSDWMWWNYNYYRWCIKKKTNTIYILLQQIVIVKKQDIATFCTQFY